MGSTTKQNLTKQEWKGLRELTNDNDIIIKRADKGGAVVIFSRNHYKNMILEHLDDTKTYKKLDITV